MNVNRLGFVFRTPAGICSTVLHTHWFDEQVGHATSPMWVILNADLEVEHVIWIGKAVTVISDLCLRLRRIEIWWVHLRKKQRASSAFRICSHKNTRFVSEENYSTFSTFEEHDNVSASSALPPFSHTGDGGLYCCIRERSSKDWPRLTVTLETSSFCIWSLPRSEIHSRPTKHTWQ